MNLSSVPATLRSWALGVNNKLNQIERQVSDVSRAAAILSSRTQRPAADYREGRITTSSPTPVTKQEDSAYFYPVTSGPIVQVFSVTGLMKITVNATAIIKPLAIDQFGMAGRFNLGLGYSIVNYPDEEGDYMPMRSGNFDRWAIQEIELGTPDAPATVNREYKFHISATQYATIEPGQHYCRTEYYLAGIGSSAQVSFANRTLVVEPI